MEDDAAPVAPAAPAAPAAGEEEEESVAWDVWCIAQGVAAACVGAVMDSAQPDVACVGAQPPGGARDTRPARLLERGCGMPVGCGAEVMRCPAELAPPRPPPPEGWEYCGPEDDDLRPVGGWEKAPKGMPMAASLAAATRKAADVTALAARERVRAGLPISEDMFYSQPPPPSDPGTVRQNTPTPTPTQAEPQPKPQSPARGQQAAQGARVLQPRGTTRAAANASTETASRRTRTRDTSEDSSSVTPHRSPSAVVVAARMKALRGEWDDEEEEDDDVDASDDEEEEGGDGSGSEGGEDDDDGGGAAQCRRMLSPEEAAALTDGYLAGGRSYEALQVAEVLREAALREAHVTALLASVDALRRQLAALPEADVPFAAAAAHLRALGAESGTSLRWAPPAAVSVSGAAAHGAAGPPAALLADVAVRLPAGCLREKDYLDCRYHARRCLYLAHIAKAMANTTPPPEWGTLCDDPRKAVLIIAAPHAPGLPRGTRLRLLPCAAPHAFPSARLAPSRGNLRAAGGAATPSPDYNAGISEDCAAEAHNEAMAAAAASAPAFGAALVLLKAWARRRGMLGAPDGVTGCLLGAACAALLSRGVLVSAMSPFQMFREALRALGDVALLRRGGLQIGASAPAAEASLAPWRSGAAGGCVVLSSCGTHNWASRLSAGAAAELAAEAGACAAALTAGGRAAADAAFLAHASPVRRHHLHVLVPLGPRSGDAPGALAAADALPLRAEEAAAEAAATRALGTRALRVRVQPRSLGGAAWWASGAGAWPAVSDADGGDGDALLVMACLDPEHASRLVDLGPSAEDKGAAASFRAFWGDKAELRRFADGAIAEAVVWAPAGAPPRVRAALPGRVAEHALRRHVARAATATQPPRAAAGALDAAAFGAAGDAPQGPPLIAALDRLGAMLKSLKALPLRVAAVAPLSPAFRAMAPLPPAPHPLCGSGGDGGASKGGIAAAALRSGEQLPACVPALDVVLSLEGSGAWPADPEAAAKTRAAFGLAAAAALRNQFGLRCAPAEAAQDVFFEGYAFRLHVTSEADMRKTAAQLAEAEAEGSVLHANPSDGPPLALRLAHASALAGAAAAHPALAPSARLVKRLLGAHLLSLQLPEEAVELLVASAFLHPRAGGPPPASREAGALAALALLAEHDWAAAALPVDLGGEWGPSGCDAAASAWTRAVASGARPRTAAMLLPTPVDPRGDAWTRAAPCAAALGRAAAVCRVASKRLEAALACGGYGDAAALHAQLFTPSLRGFDAIVRFRRAALAGPDAAPDGAPAATGSAAARALGLRPAPGAAAVLADATSAGGAHLRALPPALLRTGDGAARKALLVAFDPVRLYAAALAARFGHGALFFAPDGSAGGDALAVALRPGATQPRPALRLPHAPAAAPVGSGVTLSMDDFAAQLAECGAGLVRDVLVPSEAAANTAGAAHGHGRRNDADNKTRPPEGKKSGAEAGKKAAAAGGAKRARAAQAPPQVTKRARSAAR